MQPVAFAEVKYRRSLHLSDTAGRRQKAGNANERPNAATKGNDQMLKSLTLTAVAALATLAVAAPAHAGGDGWVNGVSLNGFANNGVALNRAGGDGWTNGIATNGWTNGFATNGWSNGISLNGGGNNGISLNGGGSNGIVSNGGGLNGKAMTGGAKATARIRTVTLASGERIILD